MKIVEINECCCQWTPVAQKLNELLELKFNECSNTSSHAIWGATLSPLKPPHTRRFFVARPIIILSADKLPWPHTAWFFFIMRLQFLFIGYSSRISSSSLSKVHNESSDSMLVAEPFPPLSSVSAIMNYICSRIMFTTNTASLSVKLCSASDELSCSATH